MVKGDGLQGAFATVAKGEYKAVVANSPLPSNDHSKPLAAGILG